MSQSAALVMSIAGRTDVGCSRSRNEDCFGIREDAGLALVCDGMGGHAGGDVASRAAADAIIEVVVAARGGAVGLHDAVSVARSAVQTANQRLLDLNRERGLPEGRGMGTTVVGLFRVGSGDRLVAFHAGDSRLYRLRDGELRQLTRDHSLYQHWLDQGGRGPAPQRNIILRAVGTTANLDPEVSVHTVLPGDFYLLCSDGLTSMLPDDGIAGILAAVSEQGLDATAERLVAAANERGGFDNITVVLARFGAAA